MTRVLQLRRGTGAQNDNFTGLSGEVTFDSDACTLRVHDGQTLGGFALARADATPVAFDIGSVSDDFWRELFVQYAPVAPTLHTCDVALTDAQSYVDAIFDVTGTPIMANVALECQSAECGYNVGDVVSAFGAGGHTAMQPNVFSDGDGLHVRLMLGGGALWVAHRDSGVRTTITPENWRAKFRVYC